MAETKSVLVPLGTQAPDFTLPDAVSGNALSLSSLRGRRGTVIMFICNHCPYVKLLNESIVAMARNYQQMGVTFIAISSNDIIQYPDDSPSKMKEVAIALAYPFPYLFDESQEIARAYDAACTPDFYLFDADLKLVYHGQYDDARPGKGLPVTGKDLKAALDSLIAGAGVMMDQKPSVGCSIKWKRN